MSKTKRLLAIIAVVAMILMSLAVVSNAAAGDYANPALNKCTVHGNEKHEFRKTDGKCIYCAEECTHDRVGIADNDAFENGKCTICGYICSHDTTAIEGSDGDNNDLCINGVCSRCGFVCKHNSTAYSNVTLATCTTAGKAKLVCKDCSVMIDDNVVLQKLEHKYYSSLSEYEGIKFLSDGTISVTQYKYDGINRIETDAYKAFSSTTPTATKAADCNNDAVYTVKCLNGCGEADAVKKLTAPGTSKAVKTTLKNEIDAGTYTNYGTVHKFDKANNAEGKKELACDVCGETCKHLNMTTVSGKDTCSDCGFVCKHNYGTVSVKAIDETCGAKGINWLSKTQERTYWKCTKCLSYFEEKEAVTPATVATVEVAAAGAHTWNSTGCQVCKLQCDHTAWTSGVCGDCGMSCTALSSTGKHKWGLYQATPGHGETAICTVCGETCAHTDNNGNPTVKATGVIEATCTKLGVNAAGTKCTQCGAITAGALENALGHKVTQINGANSYVGVKNPTCSAEGTIGLYCERCNKIIKDSEVKTSTIAHTYVTEVKTPATCATNRFDIEKCKFCGEIKGEAVEVPNSKDTSTHKYALDSVVTPATTTADGIAKMKCENCGEIADVTIAKISSVTLNADGTVKAVSADKTLARGGDYTLIIKPDSTTVNFKGAYAGKVVLKRAATTVKIGTKVLEDKGVIFITTITDGNRTLVRGSDYRLIVRGKSVVVYGVNGYANLYARIDMSNITSSTVDGKLVVKDGDKVLGRGTGYIMSGNTIVRLTNVKVAK